MKSTRLRLAAAYAMAAMFSGQPYQPAAKQRAGTDTRIPRDHSARIAAAEAKRQRRAQKRKEQQ